MRLTNKISNFDELFTLYESVGLGNGRTKDDLIKVFSTSKYIISYYDKSNNLIGVGRAFGDELDCAVICDIAVSKKEQGKGIGTKILNSLVKMVEHHMRVLLYAEPGKESFYKNNNFHLMKTAMMTSVGVILSEKDTLRQKTHYVIKTTN